MPLLKELLILFYSPPLLSTSKDGKFFMAVSYKMSAFIEDTGMAPDFCSCEAAIENMYRVPRPWHSAYRLLFNLHRHQKRIFNYFLPEETEAQELQETCHRSRS